MSVLGYIILFTLLGSLVSLLGGLALLWKQSLAKNISHYLTSFAAGTLLGAAFFDLLPEAIEEAGEPHGILFYTIIGILILFFIERSIHWFHHHSYSSEEKTHTQPSVIPLLIISDSVHNFIDGAVIALAFMVSVPLGIVTSLAVVAHEIPQEVGDFGTMLHYGMKRKNILLVNFFSAVAALMGAFLAYVSGSVLQSSLSIFLAIAAGFFIYIALADLLPEIHHQDKQKVATIQSVLLVMGIAIVWLLVSTLEHR